MPTAVIPVIYDSKDNTPYVLLLEQSGQPNTGGKRRRVFTTVAGRNDGKSHEATALAELHEETLGVCSFMLDNIDSIKSIQGGDHQQTFIIQMRADKPIETFKTLQDQFKLIHSFIPARRRGEKHPPPLTDEGRSALENHLGEGKVCHETGSQGRKGRVKGKNEILGCIKETKSLHLAKRDDFIRAALHKTELAALHWDGKTLNDKTLPLRNCAANEIIFNSELEHELSKFDPHTTEIPDILDLMNEHITKANTPPGTKEWLSRVTHTYNEDVTVMAAKTTEGGGAADPTTTTRPAPSSSNGSQCTATMFGMPSRPSSSDLHDAKAETGPEGATMKEEKAEEDKCTIM